MIQLQTYAHTKFERGNQPLTDTIHRLFICGKSVLRDFLFYSRTSCLFATNLLTVFALSPCRTRVAGKNTPHFFALFDIVFSEDTNS